ncbi:MAG: hypothetical protein IKB86_05570 [Clostridia bacterium]|nr:hypothetical protein [Clostridia bacterium]
MKRIICLVLMIIIVFFAACENIKPTDDVDFDNTNNSNETSDTGENENEELNSGISNTDNVTPSNENNTPSAKPVEISVWDGKSSKMWTKGKGIKEDPYLIETAEHLAFLAECSLEGYFLNCHFLQTANIDLGDNVWTPIGTNGRAFCGGYDGGDFTISNIRFKKGEGNKCTIRNKVYESMGLFGYLEDATVKNVHISGVKLKTTLTEVSSDVFYIGGIAGCVRSGSETIMEHCFVDKTSISIDSKADRTIYLGGIFGYGEIYEGALQRFYKLSADVEARVYVAGYSSIGGIAGKIYQSGKIKFFDICSYLDIMKSTTNTGEYYISPLMGTFEAYKGDIQLKSCYLSLNSNGDSFNITDNKKGHKTKINGCIGLHYGLYKGKATITNVFTSFTQSGNYAEGYSLFYITCEEETVTRTNSAVVYILPHDCGFDKRIWNLSDMSHPKLK